jgi:hypothetical protein
MVRDERGQEYPGSLEHKPVPVDYDQARWSWFHAQLGEADTPQLLREAMYLLQAAGVSYITLRCSVGHQ